MRNSRKTVVIHIDALRREYLSAWLLGERFKRAGYRVLLTSRHSTARLLKFFTPNIFIPTHVFLIEPRKLADFVKRGIKIYVSEVEGTDHEIGVSTTYPDKAYNEAIDYSIFSGIFVWSNYAYNWLIINRSIDPQKVYKNGSVRQSILSRPVRKTNAVVVGILSRFEIINTFDKRHFFSNLMTLDPEDADWRWYFERCAIDSETFSIVNKLMGILLKKGYRISMRPHPNENLEGYQLLKDKFGTSFELDNSYSINEWLSSVSVVFGTTSTAFTEPYLAHIPIVSTSKIQNFNYSAEDQVKLIRKFDMSAYTPATIEEAAGLCTQLSLPAKSSAELDDYFNSFYSLDNPVDPIDRIIDVIEKENADSPATTSVYEYYFAQSFLVLVDFLFLLKGALRSGNFRSLGTLVIYNYNRLLHRPSAFMKSILQKQTN